MGALALLSLPRGWQAWTLAFWSLCESCSACLVTHLGFVKFGRQRFLEIAIIFDTDNCCFHQDLTGIYG